MSDANKLAWDEPPVPTQAPAALRPGLVLCLAPTSRSRVTLAAGVVTRFLRGNPRRIGFTVWTAVTAAAETRVAPFPEVAEFVPAALARVSFQHFDLDTDYSTIMGDWYAVNSGDTELLVIEFIRP